MKQRNLIFTQKFLHILYYIFAYPALMLFACLANIIFVLHLGCKYFVFLSFCKQLSKPSNILLKSIVKIFIFLLIFRLFFKLVYFVIFRLDLSLQSFNLSLVKLDLPLQKLFIHFLWIYCFVDIFHVFLDASVGYFLVNKLTLARCQLLLYSDNLLL